MEDTLKNSKLKKFKLAIYYYSNWKANNMAISFFMPKVNKNYYIVTTVKNSQTLYIFVYFLTIFSTLSFFCSFTYNKH